MCHRSRVGRKNSQKGILTPYKCDVKGTTPVRRKKGRTYEAWEGAAPARGKKDHTCEA